jgi:putative molybdopterin biosynthesis protein
MQASAGLELLTTVEAADYLRIRERKLYELVAARQVPCTKVTGKWLFPRADLDRWLLAGMARPHGVIPANPPPIVGGSHDPLLQWALGQSRAGLASLPEGSEAGYRRFLRGEVLAAAVHFHAAGDPGQDQNVAVVAQEATLYDAVLLGFAAREQGMLVAACNPIRLSSPSDALSKKARLVVRPAGAGAQQLLAALLKRDGHTVSDCKVAGEAPTGPDVAQMIRAGHGDWGIATRAIAKAADLDFVPLQVEHFDLLIRQRDVFRPPLQKLLKLMADPIFAVRALELGGLDVSGAGCVRWAP